MTERTLSTKKYLLAFILTLLIFSGGIVFGIFVENLRVEDAKQLALSEKVSLRSLQLQQNYIESGLADCEALNTVLEANIDELGRKMNTVIKYEKKSLFSQEELDLELRDYFLTEIQFLFISQEIDTKCTKDNVKVLYFYDENSLDSQGTVLDYLKKIFGSRLLVFSFNSAFYQEPMINVLITTYGITQFPAVVVENKKMEGLTTVEELLKVICDEFQKIDRQYPQECQDRLELI